LATLAEFVVHLAVNPRKGEVIRSRAEKPAVAMMTEFGLTEEQQKIVLSHDKNLIWERIQQETGALNPIAIQHVCPILDCNR
jgi:hypothetical protein